MTEEETHPEGDAARFVVFAGKSRVASGDLASAAVAARRAQDDDPNAPVLVFNRATAEVVDLDLRGTADEIAARLAPSTPASAKRGRPKLGVVPREVTLLPRHWDWLSRQPGGASVTLRRLVETARKAGAEADEARARTETAYRFISTMAGDLPGFEEASRALFAGDRAELERRMALWPADIADEARMFLGRAPVEEAEPS